MRIEWLWKCQIVGWLMLFYLVFSSICNHYVMVLWREPFSTWRTFNICLFEKSNRFGVQVNNKASAWKGDQATHKKATLAFL